MGFFDDYKDRKRTLGIRDKQILYRKAEKKCQNPDCGKEIDFDEMDVGHKTAWSKGGKTSLLNCLCLCHRCNKLQGTDSWAVFLRKQGVEDPNSKQTKEVKQSLDALSISQLKYLAKKHNVAVKGELVEGFFDSSRKAPTKSQYINKLKGKVTTEELRSFPEEDPKKKVAREIKISLESLNIGQLKYLAKKHNVVVKGEIVEGFFNSSRKAPTKSQYINKLKGIVEKEELISVPK